MGDPKAKVKASGLKFLTWWEASADTKAQLRNWVGRMERERDREDGPGPDGALAWLDAAVSEAPPSGLFQTFIGVSDGEVVWTGSVVSDDRGARAAMERQGILVDGFFGLFNTVSHMRGRGIGWAGVNHVRDRVWQPYSQSGIPRIALFAGNPAAIRHYLSIGFKPAGKLLGDDGESRSLYLKTDDNRS